MAETEDTSEDREDTEGHGMPANLPEESDDDTEGHGFPAAVTEELDEDDTEGHGMAAGFAFAFAFKDDREED